MIGNLTPDLIVDGKVIVDPKVVAGFNEAHVAQMIGYLTITGLELAILLNLRSARLEWKRVVRQQERVLHRTSTCKKSAANPRYPRNSRFPK